jgi:hypothetical protein
MFCLTWVNMKGPEFLPTIVEHHVDKYAISFRSLSQLKMSDVKKTLGNLVSNFWVKMKTSFENSVASALIINDISPTTL